MIDGRDSDNRLPPLGDPLRRERLRRRMSLLDVGQQTRVHPRLLDAIEHDEVTSLPAPVFAIGLITTYARFLGFDPQQYVDAYKARVGPPTPPTLHPASLHAPRPRRAVPSFVPPLFVVGLLVVLAGYLYQEYAAFLRGGNLAEVRPVVSGIAAFPSPRPTTASSPTAPAVANVAATATAPLASAAPPTPLPTGTTAPALPTDVPTPTPIHGVHIDAQVSGRVWVQVETDGKIVFVGILNAGDRRSWSADQKLMIWSGNAGNVSVTYNGKPLGPLGRPGEVLKVTWTATT